MQHDVPHEPANGLSFQQLRSDVRSEIMQWRYWNEKTWMNSKSAIDMCSTYVYHCNLRVGIIWYHVMFFHKCVLRLHQETQILKWSHGLNAPTLRLTRSEEKKHIFGEKRKESSNRYAKVSMDDEISWHLGKMPQLSTIWELHHLLLALLILIWAYLQWNVSCIATWNHTNPIP